MFSHYYIFFTTLSEKIYSKKGPIFLLIVFFLLTLVTFLSQFVFFEWNGQKYPYPVGTLNRTTPLYPKLVTNIYFFSAFEI
jgi:hypothetical protein